MALAVKLEVPWDQANVSHRFTLALLHQDGQRVTIPGDDSSNTVQVEGDFELGRPAGLPHGTSLDFVVAVNISPLQLTPGERYMWRLYINGESEDEWHVSFLVRPAGASPTTA